jgi:polyphosphate kinase 2 (PPK2 family)
MPKQKKPKNIHAFPSLEGADLSKKIKKVDSYTAKLSKLQVRLLSIQQHYLTENRRAIVVFEGWDAAGKGGVIRRMNERLDPRHCRVWRIAAPTHEEQSRHYMYRFWKRLPMAGDISIFDRSWYGRVMVERVEGFASKDEWKRAYYEINEFERALADDGVRIVKLFMHISPEEQLKRFAERLRKPHKRWKLTMEDIRNREKRQEYEEAIAEMFDKTHTNHSPWYVIPAEDKLYARVRALEILVNILGKGIPETPPLIDPEVERLLCSELGLSV